MEKYVKHYMEMAFDKMETNEFFFEEEEIVSRDIEYIVDKYSSNMEIAKALIEEKYSSKRYVVRYPEIITSGRPLAKIRFYDISYIIHDGLVYESGKHNYSNWICFGKRISVISGLLETDDKCWCFDNHINFIMDDEDVTYDEYVKNYFKSNKNLKKIKKLK